MEALKRALIALVNRRDSAFWTGTVNLIVQGILRGLARLMPDADLAPLAVSLSDMLNWLLAYAVGRMIAKATQPDAPATLTEAQVETRVATDNAVALKAEAASVDTGTGGMA